MNTNQPKELHFTVPYQWVVRKNKVQMTHKELYELGLKTAEDLKKTQPIPEL